MFTVDSLKSFIQKNHKLLFFSAWFFINLIQAGTTELFDDEAYYWVYSRFPDWGYFDHPPMIAVLIRAGYFLFRNEFGLRLFAVCASTVTLYIIGELIARKNDRLFYAIACTMAAIQLGGMMAVPDVPLLFFAALFFWVYRRFIRQMTLSNSILLGVVIALMLYSKYHGVLIVLFTALSFPRLFLRYQAWLAVTIAGLLFIPHIYWEYVHGFPSVQYHLFERNAGHYQWGFSAEYILGQLLMAGPIAGFIVIGSAFAYRPADRFEKALKYSLTGFYLFFLLSTVKGRVESNWTLPAFIGLIVLSHQYLLEKERLAKWIYRLAPLTLLGVMMLRTFMMLDLPRSPLLQKDEFHGNKQWVNQIRLQSKGLPLVFIDSYQLASKYWFYSGIPALSMNSPFARRNNFNFWPLEDSLMGKEVYVVGPTRNPFFDERIDIPGWGSYRAKKIDHYFSFSRVRIDRGKTVLSPAGYLPLFQQPAFQAMKIEVAAFKGDTLVSKLPAGVVLKDLRQVRTSFRDTIPRNLPRGAYLLRYCIGSCIGGTPTVNSAPFALNVE